MQLLLCMLNMWYEIKIKAASEEAAFALCAKYFLRHEDIFHNTVGL